MATPQEIETLLHQPEGVDLEFKGSRVHPRMLGRVIAAFANTRGGTIIVGIDPRKEMADGGLTGVDPHKFRRTVEVARRRLNPQPDMQTSCVTVRGKELGVIRVGESSTTPVSYDDQVAMRTGATITTLPSSLFIDGSLNNSASTQSTSTEMDESRDRRQSGRRRRILIIAIAAFVLSGGLFFIRVIQGEEPARLVPGALIIGFSILFAGVSTELVGWRPSVEDVSRTRERVRQAEAELEDELRSRHTDSSEAEAEDEARLTLSALWAVTHRRLDHYHSIALGQAAKSFRNAQIAMAIGFVLLVGFAIVGLLASTTAGAVVAGALGAVSAALAGYVSRTFVKSQETAAGHLRAYFDQPLEFSRYLAAERLIADARLEAGQRVEIVGALVQAMIAGPAPAPDVQGTSQPGQGR
ncbi:ATP-binding protein [Streptomyces niveus]|uniref:AlbA family DNA-binding domain-containing protein n=1 Tax=Streptomyces niveus TaxID=193462 RepID=UPI0034381C02